MIYSLNGKLKRATPNLVVIECGGVGYGCAISLNTRSELPAVGEQVELLTTMLVKQDGVDLYGFSTEEEQECFRLLTGVSGVGPKSALSVLSDLPPSKLSIVITAGDYKALTKAQGIGGKTAQRIVLELKDKMGGTISMGGQSDTILPTVKEAGNMSEAMAALVALGYSATEAAQAIRECDDNMKVGDIVKQALKKIAANM